MNDPQVWTLIGVFAAVMVGAITLLLRQNDKVNASLRNELAARFDGLQGRMDAKFEAVDTKLQTIDRRLEDLDKEVANLATRFWRSS